MVSRDIPPGIRATVLERDGYRCSYCGSPYNLVIDHIIPVAKGGTSNIENLRTLCGHCNVSKGIGVRPRTIASERYRVRHRGNVLSHIKGDWFTMTKDELAKALEEYPEKLREALLRQYEASLKLDEARVDLGASRYMHVDGDFSVKRAKIEHNIRTDPSKYGLSPRPSNAAIQTALLASDEYAQLISTRSELQDNDPDTRDASILKARADKELADIEVEVLQRTLEMYRILSTEERAASSLTSLKWCSTPDKLLCVKGET